MIKVCFGATVHGHPRAPFVYQSILESIMTSVGQLKLVMQENKFAKHTSIFTEWLKKKRVEVL